MPSRWKLVCLTAVAAIAIQASFAQSPAPQQGAQSTTASAGCCGPITPAGQQLSKFLDSMNVENLWLAKNQVYWDTGLPKPKAGGTHCSAFAAAVGQRLGIYMLRPPDHSQNFLASAQGEWFAGDAALKDGWHRVHSSQEAQTLANQGELVVIVFISEDAKVHGHIAIVRPAQKTQSVLDGEGPETMQAGLHNFNDGNAVRSFRAHPGAWPDRVDMYVHSTPFSLGQPLPAPAPVE